MHVPQRGKARASGREGTCFREGKHMPQKGEAQASAMGGTCLRKGRKGRHKSAPLVVATPMVIS